MARHEYVCYTLQNPLISSWNHNKLGYSENATHDNNMSLEYEAVSYSYGIINTEEGLPEGFGQGRYDTVPSPLQGSMVEGAASSSFIDSSKLKNNAESILGNVIESINSYQNTSSVKENNNTIIINNQIIPPPNNGISNTVFPQATVVSDTTTATQKTF